MTNLSLMYNNRFGSAIAKRRAVWKVLCGSFFSKLIPPQSTVLDLACGYGEFINNIKAAKKIGVDLNPDSKQYLDPDVEFANRPATDLGFVKDGTIDVVFTSNFLEHLPDKAACTYLFRDVKRILKPGGKFIILGPNIRYAYKEYWDFYDHYLSLSHLSLGEGLVMGGFELERVIDRFLPYTMVGKTPTHDFLIRAYLALPLAWKIMGKQFLVVAKKPG
jgi:SAM-dependent methyltransferase